MIVELFLVNEGYSKSDEPLTDRGIENITGATTHEYLNKLNNGTSICFPCTYSHLYIYIYIPPVHVRALKVIM